MGVHDCLVKGIMRADMDMRRTLFGQVVLSGGSTLFPGFGDRLLNEVSAPVFGNPPGRIREACFIGMARVQSSERIRGFVGSCG